MIDLGYVPEVGDEFDDTSDGSIVRITSINHWASEIGYTRSTSQITSFYFEVMPEADFKTAVDTGLFRQTSAKFAKEGSCWHSWDTYVGFSWTYKFCKTCGEKKK